MIEQMNVPKLRFAEFEEEWRKSKLGNIGKVKMCKRIFSSQTTENGDIPFFKIGTFGKKADAFISHELYNDFKEKYSFPNVGDILMSASGTIGRTVIYSGEPSYFQDSNIVWLDNDGTFTTNNFLAYIYQVVKYQSEGGTIQRLYNSIITSTIYYNPSLLEQQKITSFLATVDKKISLLTEKKAKLTEYKKGIMQQLFNGKFEQDLQDEKTTFIPPTLRFKADDDSDFPDWEEKKFSDCFEFFTTNSLSRDKLSYDEGDVRNIHYGDIHTKFRSIFKLKQEHAPHIANKVDTVKIKADCYCKDGDLVFADASEDYADIGKCIEISELHDVKLVAGLHTHLARPKEKFATGYQAYLQKSWKLRYQIMRIAQGTKVLGISTKQLANIVLPVPCIAEQEKIASFLISLDDKIEIVNFELEKAKEWKKGLLQQMFV